MLTHAPHAGGRIGIVPSFHPSSGGEFQYSLSVIRALERLADIPDVLIFARLREREHLQQLALGPRFTVRPLHPPGRDRLVDVAHTVAHRVPFAQRLQDMRRRSAPSVGPIPDIDFRPQFGAYFANAGADWIFYTAPNVLAFEAGAPFAMPIHDMQHRLQPHFPEVSAYGEFERREYMFGNAARRARMILVDSEIGKEDVLNFYGAQGLTPDRVSVLPYLPPDYLRHEVLQEERAAVRKRYGLPQRYLFYPAQFWPHKNHKRLVEALGQLAPRHSDLNLVLAGTTEGGIRTETYRNAMDTAARLNIQPRIFSLGYVPNEDMAALYASADALVFPTFFGPTNIPILEAWALGTPVITSGIRGVREQVDNAALLIDPLDSECLANGIERMWMDEDLRRDIALRGRRRLALYDTAEFDARLRALLSVIASA